MRQTLQSTLSLSEIIFSYLDNGFKSTQDFARKKIPSNFKISNIYNPFSKFKISPKIVFAAIGVILFVGIIWFFQNTNSSTSATDSNERPLAPIALKTQEINKEFKFPIKNEDGKELSKMTYEIQKATIQDEILVKGQRARAVEGRVFLILDIKITNSYDQGLQINSKDYVRLIINGNKEELIAADIHNDPVEVQAISTKTTRIGFPINESDKNLEIQVGEINGKKETIKITVNN